MAIVKRKDSPYKNGTFPSGTNWNDYILWCLIEMAKEVDRDEAGLIDAVAVSDVSAVRAAGDDHGGNVVTIAGDVELGADDDDEEDRYPDRKFFKCGVGFSAWALWGLIPFRDSAGMQASAFSDCKKKAGFGRNTESRAALRKLMTEKNGATVDNRRGKKRRGEDDSVGFIAPVPSHDAKVILEKTLHYMASGSIEIEKQKFAAMQMRIVLDKLVDQRREEDAFYRMLDRLPKNKQSGQALLDQHTALKEETASLVRQRDELQKEELERRQRDGAISNLQMYMVVTSSSEDSTILRTGSSITNDSGSVANVPIDIDDDVVDDVDDVDDDVAGGKTDFSDDDDDDAVENTGGCIECKLPSPNHVCRKCKKSICSMCCGEKRELENVWWCGVCFATQSVATQTLIRDGLYESDEEED